MAVSEREVFDICGPLHLTNVHWKNDDHQRCVAACLVQGVYILERDRQLKRQGNHALASPWWTTFHFHLHRQLIDDADSSIFGAVYQFKPAAPPDHNQTSMDKEAPRFVVALRGTLTKPESLRRDIELNINTIQNKLHETSRFQVAFRASLNAIASVGETHVWLAGHSLGAATAMLIGKSIAKTKSYVKAFLFNSPFIAPPIGRLKDERLQHGVRIASSLLTAGLAFAANRNLPRGRDDGDAFSALSPWIPRIFVNGEDHFCSEYIGYFKHRKKMEQMGIGAVERLASRNSLGCLLLNTMGKVESEPLHVIPSANLTINLSPCVGFKEAHGIHQWWRHDLDLESNTYHY